MRKRAAGVLALLFAMTAALTGCSGGNRLDSTAEAMNVAGVSVPLGEVNFYLRYQQTQMQGSYGVYFGEDFMNQDLMGLGVPYGETVRSTVLDTLQEYYMVEAHAEELGVSLTEEERNRASEAAKAFIGANSSETLTAMTADEAAVTHVLELMALQAKVYDDRAATIDTEVDPGEVEQKRITYVMNSTAGTTDEEGNATELTEEERSQKKSAMEAVLAEAKESGDLSAAAEAQELTASSVTYGKDSTILEETALSEADRLEEGAFSEVIEGENGYYIIYMESLHDEEATQTATDNLLSQREREAYDAWYEPLKETAEITVNDDLINTLTFERIYSLPAQDTEQEQEEIQE